MSKYSEFTENLNEMNIADVISGMSGGSPCQQNQPQPPCGQQMPQPDDNVGEFGNQTTLESIEISRTDDNEIKIKTASMCVKLSESVIKALEHFMKIEGENNG